MRRRAVRYLGVQIIPSADGLYDIPSIYWGAERNQYYRNLTLSQAKNVINVRKGLVA